MARDHSRYDLEIWKPMDEKMIINKTKWTMVVYCAIVFIFTMFPPAGIVELTAFSGAIFAASFFPAIFGGLYCRWGTDIGALASMISGILGTVIWRFAFRFQFEFLKDVHEVIPAFLFSFIVYVVVSKATQSRRPDKEHLDLVFG